MDKLETIRCAVAADLFKSVELIIQPIKLIANYIATPWDSSYLRRSEFRYQMQNIQWVMKFLSFMYDKNPLKDFKLE